MKIKLSIALLFATFFMTYGQVEYLTEKSDAQDLSLKVAQTFFEKKPSKGYHAMEDYWFSSSLSIGAGAEVADKSFKYTVNIGEPIAIFKSEEKNISDFAMREVYLVRYEFKVIRLIFTYYRNNMGWYVHDFEWDWKFESEFK